eukprot:g47715.t1
MLYKVTGESKENKLSDLNSEYTTDSEKRFLCPQCGISRLLVRYGQCGHSATTCENSLPSRRSLPKSQSRRNDRACGHLHCLCRTRHILPEDPTLQARGQTSAAWYAGFLATRTNASDNSSWFPTQTATRPNGNAITKSPESVVSGTSTDEEIENEHAGGATMHEGKRNEPNGARGGRRTTRAQTVPPLVEINNGRVHRNCGACWDEHTPGPAARGRSRAAGKEVKRAEGTRRADSKLTGERHENSTQQHTTSSLQTYLHSPTSQSASSDDDEPGDGKGERSVRGQHPMQFSGCRFVLAKERRRAEEMAAAHLNNVHRPPPKTDEKINGGSLRTAGVHWQAQLAMERKTVQVQPAKQPMIPIPTDSRELREMFTAEKLLKHGPMFNYVLRR